MINIDLTKLDEKARRAISNAKERFKIARERATAASNNEALTPSDRITALRYRTMATVWEALDNPADALPECKHCLDKLHSLSAVRGSFKDELKGSLLKKEERKEIISTVGMINFVIYDVTQAAGKDVHLWSWPFVDTGEDKVDPLRDARITRLLQEQGMNHCCVKPWSFGQDDTEEHKLKLPWRIADNTQDNFIVADNKDRNVKMFDDRGKFLSAFRHPDDGVSAEVHIYDVATDGEDSIYVLFERRKPGPRRKSEYGVFVKLAADQHREFLLREELIPWSWYLPSLTVNSNNKLLVRGRLPDVGLGRQQHVIDVYQKDGQFVRCIGAGKVKKPMAIAAANNGRVMVQDEHNGSRYVRVFSELGEHLFKIKVEGSFAFADIAFDHAREQIVVAFQEAGKPCLRLLVYTKDGRTIVRSVELDVPGLDCFKGITLAKTGRVGITAGFLRKQSNNPNNDSFITPSDAFIDAEHDYKILVV